MVIVKGQLRCRSRDRGDPFEPGNADRLSRMGWIAIGVLLVLGIYLRERGSPESKPVAAPHGATGH